MLDVSRDQRRIMCQGGGGDLLVDRVFWVRNTQASPQLCFVVSEIEDIVFEFLQYKFKPCFQLPCLACIASVTNQFDATTYLAYGNHAHV